MNAISGKIPAFIGKMSNLQQIDLFDNMLTGSVPIEITKLRKLKQLNIHGNQLVLGKTKHTSEAPFLNNENIIITNNNNKSDSNAEVAMNASEFEIKWKNMQAEILAITGEKFTCQMSQNRFSCPLPNWMITDCSANCIGQFK
jgi:hypothetical protein